MKLNFKTFINLLSFFNADFYQNVKRSIIFLENFLYIFRKKKKGGNLIQLILHKSLIKLNYLRYFIYLIFQSMIYLCY